MKPPRIAMLLSRPRIGSDFPSGIVDVARLLKDDARDRRPWRKSNHTILLAAGDSDVLSTTREQKHLLHHRSYCRCRDRPQSIRAVLAQGPFPVRLRSSVEAAVSGG